MKKLMQMLAMVVAIMLSLHAYGNTMIVNDIEWTFFNVLNLGVEMGGYYNGEYYRAIPTNTIGALTIPSEFTWRNRSHPVVSIGKLAFAFCSSLTHVTIPSSVTSIGAFAFNGCSGLTSVTIPNSVTNIGLRAFIGCGLTHVTLPNRLTNVMGFNQCTSLTSVTIPDSVTSIGSEAFSRCSSLTCVTIPNSVTSIMDHAFSDSGLASISIPDSVHIIGDYAFGCCNSLTNVMIGNGVTSIGYSAFWGCIGLTSVTIPGSAMSIGREAFCGCSGLTSVTIPSNVTSIGDDAFSNCSGLTNVTISSSVMSIGSGAFSGCRRLTNVTLPSSVTNIGTSAFFNCRGDIYFKGTPPNVVDSSGNIVPDNKWSVGDCNGTYPPEYKTEWEAVIDENGKWHGLTMEVEGAATPKTYTISYDVNGGEGSADSQKVEFGSDLVCVYDGSTLHYEQHYFMGWAFAPDGDVVYHVGDNVAEPTDGDNVTLYAVWGAEPPQPQTYTITFNANGGTGKMDDMSGSNAAELLNAIGLPDPTGFMEPPSSSHKFLGWGLSADVDGVNNPDKLVKTTAELYGHFPDSGILPLFAIWGKTFTVSFDANGGAGTMPSQTFWDGKKQKLSKNAYTKGSNKFLGWAVSLDDANAGKVKYSDEEEIPVASDMPLYAVWMATVTVTFYNDKTSSGGKILSPISLRDHLYWGVSGSAGKRKSGESVEVLPGKLITIVFDIDHGKYARFVGKFTPDWYDEAPDFIYNRDEKTINLDIAGDRHIAIKVEPLTSETCVVDFVCEAGEKVAGQTFNPANVKIKLTELGRDDNVSLEGFSVDGSYWLPYGKYKVEASTSDGKWITPTYDFELSSKFLMQTVYLNFTYDRGVPTLPQKIHLNPNRKEVTVNPDDLYVFYYYDDRNNDVMRIPHLPTPREYSDEFRGWWTKDSGGEQIKEGDIVKSGNLELYAHWDIDTLLKRIGRWISSTLSGVLKKASFTQTHTFVSYLQLPDEDEVVGTMTVKTQKEKGGESKATVTIQSVGGKKQTIKGAISAEDGSGQGALEGLTFTADGVMGTLNGYSVDGAVDASKAKDSATVAVLNTFKGKAYVMALQPEEVTGANAAMVNGVAGFSIVFAAKGKAKVTGTLPDGTKVSVSSQLIVGSEWCCLPVVYSKTGSSLAFLLWFDRAGNFDSVSGLTAWKGKGFEVKWNDDVAVSKVGNLSGTSYFHLLERPSKIKDADVMQELLPLNEPVTPSGTKWNTKKADAVKMDRYGRLSYGANPSGLKLTYTAKTGTFKGALTFYTMNKGKLKESKATVSGIVVDGKGYGAAILKNIGCWPIVINQDIEEVETETAGIVLPAGFVGEYTGFVSDSSKATGNPDWPMKRGVLTMSIDATGKTKVVLDSILGKATFTAKGWDSYSDEYGYATVTLLGGGGERMELSLRSDFEWYSTELEGTVVGGMFGATAMTVAGARNRFTDSWSSEVKDGVKAFLAKLVGTYRLSVRAWSEAQRHFDGQYYPYDWDFGIAAEGEEAPLTLTVNNDGTATVSGTLNGRQINGTTQILFWSTAYYACANFYLVLDSKTECCLSFDLYSQDPWDVGGMGWMRTIK